MTWTKDDTLFRKYNISLSENKTKNLPSLTTMYGTKRIKKNH